MEDLTGLNEADQKELLRLREKEEKEKALEHDKKFDEQLKEDVKKEVNAFHEEHREEFIKDVIMKQPVKNDNPGASEFGNLITGLYGLKHGTSRIEMTDNRVGKLYTKHAADPMDITTQADGGILVPGTTEAMILELAVTNGQARQVGMNVMPLPAGTVITIPKELTLPTWDADITENTSITASKPTLETLTLTPYKGGAIVVLTNELLAAANVNIASYVLGKIGQAKATSDDSQFFAGTGSPFTGLFNTSSTYGNESELAGVSLSNITYDKIMDMIYGLDMAKTAGGSILMHRLVAAVCRKIKDDDGNPIWTDMSAGTPSMLAGIPVKLIEQATSTAVASTPVMIYGNFKNSIIGDRPGYRVKVMEEATVADTSLGQYDLVGIRVTGHQSFNVGLVSEYSALMFPAS